MKISVDVYRSENQNDQRQCWTASCYRKNKFKWLKFSPAHNKLVSYQVPEFLSSAAYIDFLHFVMWCLCSAYTDFFYFVMWCLCFRSKWIYTQLLYPRARTVPDCHFYLMISQESIFTAEKSDQEFFERIFFSLSILFSLHFIS